MPSYVVTGASRGLGYGWISHFASTPTNTVIAIVRNAQATKQRLSKDKINNVHVLSADITSLSALQQTAQQTAEITGGSLDFLIHNAALVDPDSIFKTVLEHDITTLADDLDKSLQANVIGTAHVLNAFLPLIRKGKGKKIVVTSTGMADLDFINQFKIAIATPYAVSKAATNALVGKYHAALAKEGILVFSMSPGMVDTSEGKTPTEEEIKGGQAMCAQFAEYAPHFKGPISVKESIEYQVKVIDRATVEEFGGAFVSHFGDKQWL